MAGYGFIAFIYTQLMLQCVLGSLVEDTVSNTLFEHINDPSSLFFSRTTAFQRFFMSCLGINLISRNNDVF